MDNKKGKTKPIPSQLNVYMDGSKTKQGAGSGYILLRGKGDVLHAQNINWTEDASIFQVELTQAIQEAAKHLTVNEDYWGLYIMFILDSKAAQQALKSNTCKAQTVKDAHDALNDLAAQTKLVKLTWIK